MKDTFQLELGIDVDQSGYVIDIRRRGRPHDPESRSKDRNVAIDRSRLDPLRSDAKLYGRELARQLFAASEVKNAFVGALEIIEALKVSLAVRLIIEQGAVSLFDLGWEALTDPRNPDAALFVGGSQTFSRFLWAKGGRPANLAPRERLRVIVAVASPDLGFARIDAPAERQRIRAIFDHRVLTVKVCETDGACTKQELESRLREGCDLLYLACHGRLDGEEPLIALENPDRGADIMPAKTIVDAIQAMTSPPALVVLASCESGGNPEAGGDPFFAFGPMLATEGGVPAVVAMRGSVSVATAAKFTKSLFEELLLEGQVARAVDKARRDVSGAGDWHMPALFTRVFDPYAFDPEDADDGLGEEVVEKCRRNVQDTIGRFAYAGDSYYVGRSLEKRFVEFLQSNKTAMVIIGQSGMGKTTLVARLVNAYAASAGHLCFFISSEKFPGQLGEVEQTIIDELTSSGVEPAEFWRKIDRYCRVRSRYLIIFIDAVNEYNRASGPLPPTAVDFLGKIDSLASKARAKFPNIRYVITSRPETWRKGVENDRVRVRGSDGAYYLSDRGEVPHILSTYSEEEADQAYEKYCKAFDISTAIQSLSGLTRHLLRDPLLLMLTCEVYERGQIPADLETGDVFDKYRDLLLTERPSVKPVIEWIVDEMFDEKGVVIERDAIVRENVRNQRLYNELNDQPGSAASYLIERNVLRPGPQIRFTYDRFVEYLLSEQLLNGIRSAPKKGREATAAAVEDIQANLAGAQKLNTVFGSLRRTLVRLLDESVEFARVIQRLAEDERGLTLVVSVLARIAMNPVGGEKDGLAIVDALLHAVTGAIDRKASDPGLRFPVIDAVYRMLLDAEYKIWLGERPKEWRREHLDRLYQFFIWGMSHRDETISSAAQQYLFFLWRDDRGFADAAAITDRLVHLVKPIGWSTIDETWRALLLNIISLFLLTLPELQSEREAERLLASGREVVQRIGLRQWKVQIGLRLFANKLGSWGIQKILGKAPYPIDLLSLQALVGSSALAGHFRRAIALVDSSAAFDDVAVKDLRHLATVENSFVLLAVTMALSRRYERAADKSERRSVLDLCDKIFRTGSTTGEYCTSLALYEINYFGSYATLDSMNRFADMTSTILRIRKGRFVLHERKQNYNVIGTYGRARVRNRNLLHDTPEQRLRDRPLQFAIDALTEARQSADLDYYSFICEDIGLLGVLIEPHEVFAVINYILVDLGRIVGSGQATPSPFGNAEREKLLSTVLQSLANIRVLYTEETDKFLLDGLDDPDLYAEVVRRTPKFELAKFFSWAFEQLMFRVLTRDYDKIGKEMLASIADGIGEPTAEKFLVSIIRRMLVLIASL